MYFPANKNQGENPYTEHERGTYHFGFPSVLPYKKKKKNQKSKIKILSFFLRLHAWCFLLVLKTDRMGVSRGSR